MRIKQLLGIAALSMVVGIASAPKVDAQVALWNPPGNPGPFGAPFNPVGLFETTSLGTPFFATIATNGNTFSAINPNTLVPLANNAVRLGQGLVNAGFAPTSPARWPFAPQ